MTRGRFVVLFDDTTCHRTKAKSSFVFELRYENAKPRAALQVIISTSIYSIGIPDRVTPTNVNRISTGNETVMHRITPGKSPAHLKPFDSRHDSLLLKSHNHNSSTMLLSL